MQHFIKYKNASVAFTEVGKGSALIFLHGFLENNSMWERVADVFKSNYRVICIDLLGHGKTSCLGYVHTMDEMANQVKTVMDHLKLRRVSLIGHSMGGYVALSFLEKFPVNVKKIALVNSTSKADSGERVQLRDRAIKMAQQNYESLVKMSVANLFSSASSSLLKKEITKCKKEALNTPLQGYIACTEGMKIRKETTDVLRKASCNKMIIAGKNDPILDYTTVKNEALETNSELITLNNGHMSHIEDYEQLLSALRYFIKL